MAHTDPESLRLEDDAKRSSNWKRWGPYLSERQWGTVREDYSKGGACWEYFPHDHARSRAYRWGEDGLLGICDRQGRLCFSLALWNGKDAILKERLFGLTNPEGNHGEDVKEQYFYLDATPTSSYLKGLYKYPQSPFPYAQLIEENKRRGYSLPEYEVQDTGAFDNGRYFDVQCEYAKGGPDDLCIRVTVTNRGPEAAPLHLLPMLWFRNSWSWGRTTEGYGNRPELKIGAKPNEIVVEHDELAAMRFVLDTSRPHELLFTENETNFKKLWGTDNPTPYVKDAFHSYVVNRITDAVNPEQKGTRAAAHYALNIPAGGEVVLKLRLTCGEQGAFDDVFRARKADADAFYKGRVPQELSAPQQEVARQAYAGLLWSKQYYHYVVEHWADGDPGQPPVPEGRKNVRNRDWRHLYNRDVISMPDKWEYPWYAAWDLAFHMVPMASIDSAFAKDQLLLFLREWYMHPNGQLPAYEFAFSDVNPPVHAWAAWRVYKISGKDGGSRDKKWLARVFQKLLLNFTWWVNRKDDDGNNLFSGGFLGLDNIGIFDRSKPLPTGGRLKQADGTAWMAFYASTMLAMALELAEDDPSYEDMASKFFEHFVHIVDAMNTLGGNGLWSEDDGFYYDQLDMGGSVTPLRTRSIVGVIPLFAAEVLDTERVARLPGFRKRLDWFVKNRADLARHIAFVATGEGHGYQLLAVPSRDRLEKVLRYVLDENEFLSPHGVRGLSKVHAKHPYVFQTGGSEWRVDYVPGDGDNGSFGGNSNWRGPVWFPVNYLLIEALERYDHFYGESFKVECPTGSGNFMRLRDVANELARRLSALFVPGTDGRRPCHGDDPRWTKDPAWKDLVLFHEYFHAENGRGLGASHQTGWTSLVVRCLEQLATAR